MKHTFRIFSAIQLIAFVGFFLFLIVGLLQIFPVAHADGDVTTVPPPSFEGPIKSGNDILTLFKTILKNAAFLFWIIATIFVFYAGYLFAASGNDPKQLSAAKDQLKYAVIAVAVGLMAYGLPTFVSNFLQGK
jgi:type IV secretory pathway TrbL component